ncbi:MAG: S24 family peptidase [Pseudomonadota bacterium]
MHLSFHPNTVHFCTMWETDKLLEIIEDRRRELGLTQTEVTKRAFRRNDTSAIQSIRRGSSPSVEKLAAIGDALGLELYFGPKRAPKEPDFDNNNPLPHKGLAKCGINGWSKAQEVRDPLPAPSFVSDELAFYVTPTGQSMIPEGIPPAALCLVTPSKKPVAGDRVWIRDKNGGATIKRLVEMRADRVLLRGWLPRENETQQSFDEERFLTFIEEIYPIAAVFKDLTVDDPSRAQLIPDPRSTQPTATPAPGVEFIEADRDSFGFEASGVIRQLWFPSAWLKSKSLTAATCALVHVADGHMAPDIPVGATALINKSETNPEAGRSFAVKVDGKTVIRRLYQVEGGRVFVTAADPQFPPSTHAPSALSILGRVEWVGHSFI